MPASRLSMKGLALAAMLGTALLTPGLALAQENTTRPGIVNLIAQPPGNASVVFFDVDYDLSDHVVARFLEQPDQLFGATLKPVGEVLRAQLSIPAGQGLLVASLRPDGPSAQAGLKQNDILLTLAGKPLAAADDLSKQLKAAGETAVHLQLLRAGKPLTIQVRPIYRVTLGPSEEHKKEYHIGVSIDPVDDGLRAQLALPAGQGVVVSDVIAGSPAEKAGVKKYDIVLTLADKAIDQPETLARQVQATQDKPTTLKLLRGGKPLIIPLTAAIRVVESSPPQDAQVILLLDELLEQRNTAGLARDRWVTKFRARTDTEDVRQRLDRLDKELKALREALERVNETLKAGKATNRD